jgi:hypothetical protein
MRVAVKPSAMGVVFVGVVLSSASRGPQRLPAEPQQPTPVTRDSPPPQRLGLSDTAYQRLCEAPFDSASVARKGCVLRDQSRTLGPKPKSAEPQKAPPQ